MPERQNILKKSSARLKGCSKMALLIKLMMEFIMTFQNSKIMESYREGQFCRQKMLFPGLMRQKKKETKEIFVYGKNRRPESQNGNHPGFQEDRAGT